MRYRTRFQASSGNSDSANWPGYEAEAERLFSTMNKTKGGSARRVKDAKVFRDFSSYPGSFFYTIYYIKAKNYNIKQLLIILLKDTKSYGGRKERYSTVG